MSGYNFEYDEPGNYSPFLTINLITQTGQELVRIIMKIPGLKLTISMPLRSKHLKSPRKTKRGRFSLWTKASNTLVHANTTQISYYLATPRFKTLSQIWRVFSFSLFVIRQVLKLPGGWDRLPKPRA